MRIEARFRREKRGTTPKDEKKSSRKSHGSASAITNRPKGELKGGGGEGGKQSLRIIQGNVRFHQRNVLLSGGGGLRKTRPYRDSREKKKRGFCLSSVHSEKSPTFLRKETR